MKSGFVLAALGLSIAAWACSSSDESASDVVPETDAPATVPSSASTGSNAPPDDSTPIAEEGDAGVDAAPLGSGDAAAGADAAKPKPPEDAGTVICMPEIEPNDVEFQQLPRSLCGKLSAGDVDRFYIEGRKDEPIQVVFSAEADARVTLKTNAGLTEAFFGKSFMTVLKPGDRKLLIEVSLSKGMQAYHLTFERK